MNTDNLIDILGKIADRIDDERDYLSELDNAIGDGDHGINMARGFTAVRQKLPDMKDKDPGEVLYDVGMILISNVGGASGPLYGTAFMKAGSELKGKAEFDINDFSNALYAAVEGVMKRGRSKQGEKTLLDAMIPSLDALKTELANGNDLLTCLEEALAAAEDGVYYTKTIIANKGRASYLGSRSIGHQDPGATSYTIILETIYNELKKSKGE